MFIASSYREWCNVDTESALNVRKYVRKVRINSEREQSEPRLTVSFSSSLTIGKMRSLACLLPRSILSLVCLLAYLLAGLLLLVVTPTRRGERAELGGTAIPRRPVATPWQATDAQPDASKIKLIDIVGQCPTFQLLI